MGLEQAPVAPAPEREREKEKKCVGTLEWL
jgi:hypothetical protein